MSPNLRHKPFFYGNQLSRGIDLRKLKVLFINSYQFLKKNLNDNK